jgi:TRAP-type C4-dicarboxylate transport system permease small subunit
MGSLRALHDRITAWGFVGAYAAVGLITVSFWYEVLARYFLAAPTVWAYATASYAICPMIFLAMPEMTRRGSHIAVTYVTEALPPRYRTKLGWVVTLLVAVFCLIVAWITGAETWRQYVREIETISAFPIPKWWVSIFIPYGFLSSGIYFLRHLFEPPPVAQPDEALS